MTVGPTQTAKPSDFLPAVVFVHPISPRDLGSQLLANLFFFTRPSLPLGLSLSLKRRTLIGLALGPLHICLYAS